MKNKLLSIAGLLAVFNLNAIEIGPTGSGVELSGFVVLDHTSADKNGDGAFMSSEVELDLDWSSGPVSFDLDIDVYKNGENLMNGADTDGTSLEGAVNDLIKSVQVAPMRLHQTSIPSWMTHKKPNNNWS